MFSIQSISRLIFSGPKSGSENTNPFQKNKSTKNDNDVSLKTSKDLNEKSVSIQHAHTQNFPLKFTIANKFQT